MVWRGKTPKYREAQDTIKKKSKKGREKNL